MSLMRANLSDPREDLDNSKTELTYKIPAEPESLEKWRETLREPPKR